MTPAWTGARLRVGVCLSLTGRYATFGAQAAHGLKSWATLDGGAEIVVIDDRSEPSQVAAALSELVNRCDLLLGPYSTQLMRAANRVIGDLNRLLWNHGGSGDDVETATPGHVVSVLAPTSRYAEPYVQLLANRIPNAPLFLRCGQGRFGVQVVDGAERSAVKFGLRTQRLSQEARLPTENDEEWDLFCAATFPEDVATVRQALGLSRPPRTLGTVAAGVQEFGREIRAPRGIYGIAQWMPGRSADVCLGPPESEFIREYRQVTGQKPDYPAVQAAAAAVLATHCARTAGDVARSALWAAATSLRATTLFGPFGIDPTTGEQQDHRPVLTRWTAEGLVSAAV
jgi:ABC-type branched-subunit amino acid transport system substrate-binding protein